MYVFVCYTALHADTPPTPFRLLRIPWCSRVCLCGCVIFFFLLYLSCTHKHPYTQDQLSACMSLYVEDQLSSHFKELLEYVKKAEQQQKRNAIPDGQCIPGGWVG